MAREKNFDPQRCSEAAMHLFWQRGFAGTSVSDLLDAMGINRASMYNTLGNKESVFFHSLVQYNALITQTGIDILESAAHPVQGILDLFEHKLINTAAALRAHGCLLLNTISELANSHPEYAQLAQTFLYRLRGALTAVLHRAQDMGYWQAAGAKTLTPEIQAAQGADFLFHYLLGLRTQQKLQADTQTLRRNIRTTLLCMGFELPDEMAAATV